ncbi:YtzI protein [Virgibacillus kekensis]|uniref:YtzI protein n=1 Tax=Virgibacillus kekensis TaxID=202261 RepID=A0ABV9DM38_9BACI
MTTQIIIAVSIMLVVLLLTLAAISKGYAYKHTVDPMPGEDEEKEGKNEQQVKNDHTK